MPADVNLGSPTQPSGTDSDEIHNSGGVLAEGETIVTRDRDSSFAWDTPYRTGYREGFRDAGAAKEPKAEDKPDEKAAKEDKPPSRLRWIGYAAGALLLVALIVAGVIYWLDARHYESTDDAFIDAHVANVSSQIAGRVTKLLFDDNQSVTAGQTLIEIDPRDYQEKLNQGTANLGTARAQIAQARAQLDVRKADLDQATAQVKVSEADARQADQDLARYRGVDPRAVTRQDVDKATAQSRAAQARLEASRSAVAGAQAQVEAAKAAVSAAEATAHESEVGVANAQLQLSYTRIAAPIDGRVAKRNVELGTNVAPGQALVSVVPTEMWVTANFKETQLTEMKPGDPVDISIDSYPGTVFHGRVDSFQTGTGSAFSTLPAENATGNYVKVVQRLPVKIVFDDKRIADVRLAPGLSVVPRVKVR